MTRPTEAICVRCGAVFPVKRKGPIPDYCKPSHRQRAYEQRRIDSAVRRALLDAS